MARKRNETIETTKVMEKAKEDLRRLELRFQSIEGETHYMEGGWDRVVVVRNGTARPLPANPRRAKQEQEGTEGGYTTGAPYESKIGVNSRCYQVKFPVTGATQDSPRKICPVYCTRKSPV